jgi:hypothetical protein
VADLFDINSLKTQVETEIPPLRKNAQQNLPTDKEDLLEDTGNNMWHSNKQQI